MKRRLFTIKIIREEANIFKTLAASFDESAIDKRVKEMNDKKIKNVRYEKEDVPYIEEIITDEDF